MFKTPFRENAYLRAAVLVHRHGFTTVIPHNGLIASGGTDFFLAGRSRIVESGARIGVHSWGEIAGHGSEIDRDDEAHEVFLEFFRQIQSGKVFRQVAQG